MHLKKNKLILQKIITVIEVSMKFYSALLLSGSILAMSLTGCTNPTSKAGTRSTYYEGVIEDIEIIDIDTNQMDNGNNTIIGAIAGAIIGNMVNNHSTGTIVGAGLCAVAGNAVSKATNRTDGVRLTVETDNGPMIIDMPFSCKYKVGKKVRLVSDGDKGTIMVETNGKYKTATQDSYNTCPTVYEEIKSN